MSSQTLGILIGGLIPGLIFGLSNVVVKLATQKGIALPLYIIITGLAVVAVGIALLVVLPDRQISMASGTIAFSGGALWAIGMTCIVIALQKYGASISVLTPLFNMNTLVAVILGMWIFAEWRTVSVPQLLMGAALITAGATMVARA
jgi:drug/metabolite transporter (DMT)-like permease